MARRLPKFIQFQTLSNQLALIALDSSGQLWMNLDPHRDGWVGLPGPAALTCLPPSLSTMQGIQSPLDSPADEPEFDAA
jgi:hypothetical protein